MREEITFQTINSQHEWNILLNRTRHSDLMQTWEYGEAIKRTVGFEPVRQLILRNNHPIAMAQVLLKEISGMGPVARIQNGPLFFDTDEIWQPMTAFIAIRELKNFWVTRQQRHLYLTPCLFPNEMPKKWYKEFNLRTVSDPIWSSVKIDISQAEDEIRSRMKRQWRKSLDRAERNDYQVKVSHENDDFQFFLLQYKFDLKANSTLWPTSELLVQLWHAANESCQLFLLHRDDNFYAGLLTFAFGNTAIGLASWDLSHSSDKEGIRYLVWRAILHYRELRYRWFDLGACDPARKIGATAFKRTTGGVEYSYIGNYEAFPTFLSREKPRSRKNIPLNGFLPGLDWPLEEEKISSTQDNSISVGVTRAVTRIAKDKPAWDGVLSSGMPLLSSGLIDSIDLLELAQDLQERFAIQIFPEEINSRNFGSISSISRFVQEKMTIKI